MAAVGALAWNCYHVAMLINLVQLRTFVAVAEERHMTRAADRLNISRSAASEHIRAVEARLRLVLFSRTNRSLELTHAGTLLMQQAKVLLNQAAQFASFSRALHGELDGELVISANSDPVKSRIGEIFATLRERCPLISVDLRARHSAGTLQGLRNGEIDAGILTHTPIDPGITWYTLTTVRFMIVGPVAWKDRLAVADWSDLAAMPWTTSSDENLTYASWLRQQFADRGLTINRVVRFDNAALAQPLPQAGVGLMLMREEHALQGERAGLLAVSSLATAEFPLLFAHLTSRGHDPLIQAFVDAVGAVWPEMHPASPRR
jgi:DNA-binding transcriptional LysR family regulator